MKAPRFNGNAQFYASVRWEVVCLLPFFVKTNLLVQ